MYLSEDLITSVKRRCNVPTSQITFQVADFLAFADEEGRAKLLPMILKHMEEYYVYPMDYPIEINKSIYPIPTRAAGMELRDVEIISTTDPDTRVGLERLNREDLYGGISGSARFLVKKSGFYVRNNSIELFPTPLQAVNDVLRLSYYMRPNTLVPTATCALIQSIDLVLNTITVVSVPSNITNSTPVDLIRALPGFECTAIDQSVTIVGNVLTFASPLPENVQVGDYVCQAYQSCVVQYPVELQPLLFQYVCVRILAAQGDQTNLKSAMMELDVLEKNAGLLLSPRVSGKSKRVVNSRGIVRWV